MKLPNHFGSIVKLAGNRRRPYAVRKDGKYLAYFADQEDALAFLVDYNKKPLLYAPSRITFAELYRLEMQERTKRLKAKTIKGYASAFRNCLPLHDMPIKSITVADLQGCINQLSAGQPTQKKARQVMHNVYRYAVKYQFIEPTQDISKYVDIAPLKRKYRKTPFTARQLGRLRKHDSFMARCVLMMCYAGVRPSEFLALRKSDVHLKQRYFIVCDSKTVAGQNRIVPISLKTLPYYVDMMQHEGLYLLGEQYSYSRFLRAFKRLMAELHMKHLPHECRHTCATMLDNAGANKLSIKRILGHATNDITDGVYTHKDLRQLKKAIDLI